MEDLYCTVFPECFTVIVSYFINFSNPILYANIHIFSYSHDVCTLMCTSKYILSVFISILLSSILQHGQNNPPNISDYVVF